MHLSLRFPTWVFVIIAAVLLALWCAVPALSAGRCERTTTHAASEVAIAAFSDVNGSSDTPAASFGYVCAGMKSSGATVALSAGDALRDIADTSTATAVGRWNKYLAVETVKLGTIPVWRTAGDNDRLDVTARLAAWNQVFSAYPTTADASRRWYSLAAGDVHVVMLNTAYSGHMGWIGYYSETSSSNSAEAAWLVKDLKAASAESPSSIVVVMHYPLLKGKTSKPYAGSKATEAKALETLFAKYGVDLVVAADTHVYRRTMLTVHKGSTAYSVPYIQLPPAASTPRTFGASPIPSLGSTEAGWAPSSSYRGFVTITLTASPTTMTVAVRKVRTDSGAVSSAEDKRANDNRLGGTFPDVPSGCSLGAP